MLEQVLLVLVAGVGCGTLGYVVGSLQAAFWRGEAGALSDTVTSLNADCSAYRAANRDLNAKLFPLEIRETKRVAQLRAIAPLGGKAQRDKRLEARKAAVAKTMAAIVSLISEQSKSSGVAASKESVSASL